MPQWRHLQVSKATPVGPTQQTSLDVTGGPDDDALHARQACCSMKRMFVSHDRDTRLLCQGDQLMTSIARSVCHKETAMSWIFWILFGIIIGAIASRFI